MMTEAVLEEMNNNWEKWKSLGMLEGLDKDKFGVLAVLLENQQLLNEMCTDTGDIAQFKRISFSLVKQTFTPLLDLNLVNIFPMLGPTAFYGNEQYFAQTRKFKKTWTYETQQNLRAQYDVDKKDKELIQFFGKDLFLEIFEEIITDLYSNSLVTVYGKTENLFKTIDSLIETEQIDWIGGHSNIVNKLTGKICNSQEIPELSGHYQYKDKSIPIYHFPGVIPENQLITASKNSYVYAPYVPVNQTPTVLDPVTFVPKKGMMIRYSKKVVSNKGICRLIFNDCN